MAISAELGANHSPAEGPLPRVRMTVAETKCSRDTRQVRASAQALDAVIISEAGVSCRQASC